MSVRVCVKRFPVKPSTRGDRGERGQVALIVAQPCLGFRKFGMKLGDAGIRARLPELPANKVTFTSPSSVLRHVPKSRSPSGSSCMQKKKYSSWFTPPIDSSDSFVPVVFRERPLHLIPSLCTAVGMVLTLKLCCDNLLRSTFFRGSLATAV